MKVLFSGVPVPQDHVPVIAGSLGLDMFKVDLSSVVSRWVGETEKNLKEIFDAAEGGGTVILFDEADSLFDPVATSNKPKTDSQIKSKLCFNVSKRLKDVQYYNKPARKHRRGVPQAVWGCREFPCRPPRTLPPVQRAFPSGAPRDEDLDLQHLADQFILAGGAIITHPSTPVS